MSHRSRLTASVGDCIRRQAGRLAGLRPPPAPAPTFCEGVNVLLTRTEEIQSLVTKATTEKEVVFAFHFGSKVMQLRSSR